LIVWLERRAGGDASSEEPSSDEDEENLDQSDKSSRRSMSVESESEIHEGPTVAQSCCLGTKKSKKVPNVAESGGLVGLYFAGLKKLANFCGEDKEISFLGNMKYVYLSKDDSQKNLAPFLAKSFADDYLHGMMTLAPVALHWPIYEGTDKHGVAIEKSCSGPTSDASDQSKKRRAGKVEGPAKYAEAVIENSLFVTPGTTNVTDAEEDVVEWGSADWLDKLKFSMTAEELGQRKPVRIQRLIDVDPSGEHAPTITHPQLTELMAECLNLEMVWVDRSKQTNRALTWYVRCTCCAVSFQVWSTCPIEGLDKHLRAFDWRHECLRNAEIGAVKHVTSCEHLALYCSRGERLTGVMGGKVLG
jgi:hypothetical protein